MNPSSTPAKSCDWAARSCGWNRNLQSSLLRYVGRVLFNDILDSKMAFYDLPLSGKHLSRIIADCYQFLGRRETIELLDRMKETGFRESTRSGLSFSTDDLKTPPDKEHMDGRQHEQRPRHQGAHEAVEIPAHHRAPFEGDK